ncbi:alpha/beta hydrolase fold domain-containing protein [Nonomuraea sp. 3N208]|uniref:alpha/beta hydrolase fold domain-containing protein n=1 Tax=Nonomuraea sp. 3N208 TaxID=3457421 RepID=UPI003FCEB1EA
MGGAEAEPRGAQADDATAVYRWLLDQGISADRIVFTGDSAGGGLSVGEADARSRPC